MDIAQHRALKPRSRDRSEALIEQMTKADLRRAIAKALGWKRERREEPIIKYGSYSHSIEGFQMIMLWIAPNGTEHQVGALYSESLPFPDWPHDPGAARALCLEIGEVAIGEERGDPQVGVPHGYFAHFGNNPRGVKYATTPSEALARLALAALEAQAVNA